MEKRNNLLIKEPIDLGETLVANTTIVHQYMNPDSIGLGNRPKSNYDSKRLLKKSNVSMNNFSNVYNINMIDPNDKNRLKSELGTQVIGESSLEDENCNNIEEVLEFENQTIIKKIGYGAFSEAFQVMDEISNEEYALRSCEIDNKNYTLDRAKKEVQINLTLMKMDHPNIAKIYSSKIIHSPSIDDNNLIKVCLQVVMELGVCTLENVIKKRRRESKYYSESELIKICSMLIHAMNTAKQYGINHRDISLGNIVLDKNLNNYKQIDFGEAELITIKSDKISLVGKQSYMAPEIKKLMEKVKSGEKFGPDVKSNEDLYNAEKADVYSLGIALGNIALLGDFDARMKTDEIKSKLEKIQKSYPKIYYILSNMTQEEPEVRSCFHDLRERMDHILTNLDNLNIPFFEQEFDSGLKLINSNSKYSSKSDDSLTNNVRDTNIPAYDNYLTSDYKDSPKKEISMKKADSKMSNLSHNALDKKMTSSITSSNKSGSNKPNKTIDNINKLKPELKQNKSTFNQNNTGKSNMNGAKNSSMPESEAKKNINWGTVTPITRDPSKFGTNLKSTNKINSDYQEFYKKGEFNLANNLYQMAIVNFLKAYELLKRSGQDESDDHVFETTLKISFCIATCQKALESYEEATNILQALLDSIFLRANLTQSLQEWHTFICAKLSEVLMLRFKYQEAHEMQTEGLNSIKSPKGSYIYIKNFVELVSLKSQIWLRLGYYQDALQLQKKIRTIINTKLNKPEDTKNRNQKNSESGDTQDTVTMFNDKAQEIMNLNCDHSMALLEIYCNNFTSARENLNSIEQKYVDIYGTKYHNENFWSIQIDKLKYTRFIKDHSNRRKLLGNFIQYVMSLNDVYKLLKSNLFLELNKEYILYTMDGQRYKEAEQVLEIYLKEIDMRSCSGYWKKQYNLLKAKMSRLAYCDYNNSLQALELMLKELETSEGELKNWTFWVDIKEEISLNHYYRGDYQDSLTVCLEILNEYFYNKKVYSNTEHSNLKIVELLIRVGNIYRKMNEFENAEANLKSAQKMLSNIFIPNYGEDLITYKSDNKGTLNKESNKNNYFSAMLFKNFGKLYLSKNLFKMQLIKISQVDNSKPSNIHNESLESMPEALRNLSQSIGVYVEIGKLENTGNSCAPKIISLFMIMAKLTAMMNQFDQSLSFHMQGQDLCEKLDIETGHKIMTSLMYNLGTLCLKFDKFDLALEFLSKGIDMNKASSIIVQNIKCIDIKALYYAKGAVYLKKNDKKNAQENYQNGMDQNTILKDYYKYFERNQSSVLKILDCFVRLSKKMFVKGDICSAFICNSEAIDIVELNKTKVKDLPILDEMNKHNENILKQLKENDQISVMEILTQLY